MYECSIHLRYSLRYLELDEEKKCFDVKERRDFSSFDFQLWWWSIQTIDACNMDVNDEKMYKNL